jgi:hypothetical protein
MEDLGQIITTIFISILVGTLYWEMMRDSIDVESDCSFIATIWTDILAIIIGLISIILAILYNTRYQPSNNIYRYYLLFTGTSIITEHVLQVLSGKKKEMREN